ncbi:MAG TPA: metallophosphoesterase [Phycisphaerae bacterium]|nr:metallophosphoesterase [Phycisphaerae bacterium]HNU43853.1 metallophosphoesterase [Phycisphaerae bacterium]
MMTKHRRGVMMLLCLSPLLSGLGCGSSLRPVLATELLGPVVQAPTPDSFSVIWSSVQAAAHAADETRFALRVLDDEGGVVGAFPAECSDGRCLAEADGLAPGVRYRYEVVSTVDGGEVTAILAAGSARTSPPRGNPFEFLAFGDNGPGRESQHALARVMARFSPDLIVHTGDLIFADGALEGYPDRFYEPYAPLLARAAFYMTLGNHDYARDERAPVLDTLILPANGPPDQPAERNYWFDYGDVRFVCIDSNAPSAQVAGSVVPWLEEVLAEAGARWKIVWFHRPIYTHAFHLPAGALRDAVAPVFDRYGVHLVLCGHNHLYERSYPIRAGKPVPEGEGTVYITTGASGQHRYKARPFRPAYMAMQVDSQFSFTVVDVGPDSLCLRQIGERGEVLDEYRLVHAAGP